MRFKRYRKRGYRSRVVKMKFQSFFDIATEADQMQIISVNAGGKDVVARLAPFFSAYKYYKLGKVTIKLIPASTLPIDPTGLSYEEGENTVDPRDQLTPGMCRITNGEDILEDITGLDGDQQRELYQNMMLDPRWYKWMLQTGVKRFARPKYWQIGQLHQDKWPGSVTNLPIVSTLEPPLASVFGTAHQSLARLSDSATGYGTSANSVTRGSSSYGIFQTGHKGVLGWLPTDSLQVTEYVSSGQSVEKKSPMIAAIPEIELFKILMPPMRKTNYYYRAFVTEECYFKEPIVMNVNGYRPIDVFQYQQYPIPRIPTEDVGTHTPPDSVDGGNDGSN